MSASIARHAPVPRHILVPHDFSDTAEQALSFAIDLAGKLGADITVMHVYEIPTLGYAESVGLSAEFLEDVEREARAGLEGIAARTRRPGVEVQSVLRQGLPWFEIDSTARQCGADLIVMGTHGRHGLSRALFGSVAEKVVRTAPCPVLTVRGSESVRGS